VCCSSTIVHVTPACLHVPSRIPVGLIPSVLQSVEAGPAAPEVVVDGAVVLVVSGFAA
jgi:hypothetical protein